MAGDKGVSVSLFSELLENTATISLGAVLIALLGERLHPNALDGKIFAGLIFAAIGLLSMANPITVDDFYYDGRVVVIILSGAFGGYAACVITTLAVAGMRYYLGGAGVSAGLISISSTFLIAIAYQFYITEKMRTISIRDLVLLGTATAAIPISVAFFLNLSLTLLEVSLISAITNFVGIFFCGLILVWDRERRANELRLSAALNAAKAANEAKNRFIAHLSHEVRNPLASLIAGVDILLKEKYGPIGSAKYREYLGMMKEAGSFLKNLVDNLLDTRGIEVGKITLNKELTDVSTIVGSVRNLMLPRAEEAGVLLTADNLPHCYVYADAVRLQQILVNLVSNSIRFTRRGGTVRMSANEISAEYLQIMVKDTGIGIAPDDMERVFKPFEQVYNSQNRSSRGTGLGLPIAKALIELHGGSFRLESILGEGTSAIILLPSSHDVPDRSGVGADLEPAN